MPVAVGAVDGDGPRAGNVAGTPDPSADGAVGTVPGADPAPAGAPLSGAPLSGAPLSGAPLSGAPLSGAPPAGAPPAAGALDGEGAPLPPPGMVAVATAIGEPVGTGDVPGAEELAVGPADADDGPVPGADAGALAEAVGEADGDADAVGEADGDGDAVGEAGAEAVVAGQVVVPAVGLPGPGVTGAAWRVKQAATATPLPSAVVDTWFCTPNEPQFRLSKAPCSRADRNVKRLSPVSVAGLGAPMSRLTSCCSRLAWMFSMSAQ
jgi:hypothetical protein